MDKQTLRQQQKLRLKALNATVKSREEQHLYQQLLSSATWQQADTIGITLSLPFELDTKPLIKAAWGADKQVVVPKVEGEQLTWWRYEPTTILAAGALGILEPQTAHNVVLDDIDLLIVPGLAFTQSGKRLGYGGGFYDRTLVGFNGDVVSVVLQAQLVDDLPALVHDQMIPQLITAT